MLCQFTFRNFKSYKEETVLDFQATSGGTFQDSLLCDSFLPVAVIYGPNAGGKSNVLKALNYVYTLVMRPIIVIRNPQSNNLWDVECKPFLFDEYSRNSPSEFELFFRSDEVYEYRYTVSVLDGHILSESLYRKKIGAKGQPAMLFERSGSDVVLGASLRKSSINTGVNDSMPYLSFLAVNYRLEPIDTAIIWFEKCCMKNYANPFSEIRLFLRNDDDFKKKLITLMNETGVTIHDFQIQNEGDERVTITFQHKIDDKIYPLDIAQESDGTQKLFNVLPLVMIALSEGKLLVFDELDAKLHPKLLIFLIKLFKNKEINRHNAQLVFTSHDVSSMRSTVFRTDEIWFACKNTDESSDLYSLYELRDEHHNHISPSAAFDKQYLEGRYGADPYFQSMMNWG